MRTLLFSLAPYLKRYLSGLLAGILFLLIANFVNVYPAVVVRKAIDLLTRLQEEETLERIFIYGGIILLLALVRGFFWFLVRQKIIVISRKIEKDLRKDIFKKYLSFSFNTLKTLKTGDLMSRITEDLTNVRMFLGPGIMYSLNTSVLFVMVLINMFQVNVRFSLFVLTPLPVLALIIYFVHSRVNVLSKKVQEQLSVLTAFSQETYSGIRAVKAYAKEAKLSEAFSRHSREYYNRSMELVKFYSVFHPVIILLVGFSSLFTVWIGGKMVMENQITYGNIAEFVVYINLLIWPMSSLGWISSMIELAIASQERINALMRISSDVEFTGKSEYPVNTNIFFQEVSFRYENTGIIALRGINFSITEGMFLGITGKTGSGKTTLVQLLLRLFEPTQGRILLGNKPLSYYSEDVLYDLISYAPQEPFLFSDTIRENLLYGNSEASEEEIIRVLKAVNFYEELMHFPEGLETLIGERGVTLSGGQRQRLSLARALLKEAPILILDDVVSALDTETANKVLQSLRKEKRTLIVISHRLDAFFTADNILVMHSGKIIEQGTHQELVRKAGYYKKLLEQGEAAG